MLSKLPQTGATIFTVMSSLAAQHNAINLGQGFPDFDMDPELAELVSDAMRKGHNQYTHMNGLPYLRERIAEKVKLLYDAPVHPDRNITITPGATYGLFTAITALVHPGDEVIFFEPAYDSYAPAIKVNGGIPVPVKLQHPHYNIPWDEVAQKISPQTRMIIINSPHNPTGALLQAEDLNKLAELIRGRNIYVLSDEVYEHIVFDEGRHHSVLSHPELRECSLCVFSFGKVYHCTGWKMGYVIANDALTEEFRKVHQFNCFTCNTPVQYALASFLEKREHYLRLGNQLQEKRDHFARLMQATPLTPLPSGGSYFQLYDYSPLSNKPESDYAIQLVEHAGVAVIPVSAFYGDATSNSVLRFCFAKKESTLEEAVNRLKNYFAS